MYDNTLGQVKFYQAKIDCNIPFISIPGNLEIVILKPNAFLHMYLMILLFEKSSALL